MKQKIKVHHLKLTTLTPVSVGGDQNKALSPYTDYVFSEDGQSVNYIKHSAIEKGIGEDEHLMNQYLDGIKLSMNNNRSEFDLKSFITGSLALNLGNATKKSVPNYGLEITERQQIAPIVKSAGRPFIPGSTIKGAIRTAILYDWLAKTNLGEPKLRNYVRKIKEWDRKEGEIWRLKKQRGDRRRMGELSRDIRNLKRDIFREDELFGRLNDRNKGPEARRIQVSDTAFLEEALSIYGTKRIRLRPGKGKSTIPAPREALLPDFSTTFSISVQTPMESEILKYWESDNTDEILTMLNGFTKTCITNELYELKEAQNPFFRNEIRLLVHFYEGLKERIDDGEVFLRIGSGKTVYDNSLILTLIDGLEKEEADEAFFAFRRAVHRVRRDDALFPVTRTMTANNLPLGWVKIEKS